jgi:hypothetical protein
MIRSAPYLAAVLDLKLSGRIDSVEPTAVGSHISRKTSEIWATRRFVTPEKGKY